MTTPAVSLPQTEDHTIRSERVGAELHLWIAHPVAGWRGPASEPPRVLYLLDADLFFGTAVETTRLMHMLYGELPPVLVVGIAYGAGPRAQAELRNRDLTPTVDSSFAEMPGPLGDAGESLLPEDRRMGRAREFLDFLVDEARPWVESRFEVAPEGRMLFGSSLGGLFALYALLTEPGAFDHYAAVSPALWWDDETLFDLEEHRAAESTDLAAELYLASGALEEPPGVPLLSRFKLVTNMRRMAERLEGRGYPSLRVHSRVLDGETHTTVVAPALSRALRTFLASGPRDSGGS